ncbi:immunity 49 family protein [Streptomyces sp. W1SF4]|uniref:immunity 49 family protein n=1 Tax=Streptomyces sp. W1SF4 TaxID=2305220 RepID=UPI001F49B3EF|nr:immunity 49 family protein [Streptomyces sp. W1SF4]
MRIERHQVDGAAVAAAREDFVDRIGGRVRSMSRAGRMATNEWRAISGEFLDYLGALSVESPDLRTPEAEAVVRAAAEAAAGAVAFAGCHPHRPFSVFLDYVGFGMSYDPCDEDASDGPEESVGAAAWTDALCLAVLADRAGRHGEAFRSARRQFAGRAVADAAGEFATGLMAVVFGDTGDDGGRPAGAPAELAAVDAAPARPRARAEESCGGLLDRPHGVALRTLRALAAEDREAFDSGMAALLAAHRELSGPGSAPSSLLPLVPLGLAALAYRNLGWAPALDTGYLPGALVDGFATAGPRVGGFGRDRRPDAVAALAAGPLAVGRPVQEWPMTAQTRARAERRTREALDPADGAAPSAWRLGDVLRDQDMLFKGRAALADDVTDAQWENLRLASRAGAALFRVALAEPGTVTEVAIAGRTLRYPAERSREAGAGAWAKAVALALITGEREDLAPLVLAGPAAVRPDTGRFAAYREALHAHLRGADAGPATERALREAGKDGGSAVPAPPAVLLSQLVGGDEESFNLALADALEAHRDHFQVADRADGPDAAVSLDVLALACHARRRGWDVRVRSPYLPGRLLEAAAVRS